MTDSTRHPSDKPGSVPPLADKHVSSRPPPSMAPPTDDIDAEWGASPEPSPAALKPAPLPSIDKPRSDAPLEVTRKQTLLGLSPPVLGKSTPPPVSGSATRTPLAGLMKPASVPPAAAKPASDAATPQPASVAPASAGSFNRKGTLLGLAPPIVPTSSAPPAASASQPPASAASAKTGDAKPAASKDASAKALEGATTGSDTPLTADLPSSRAKPRTESPPSSTAATHASQAPARSGRGGTALLVLLAAAAVVVGIYAASRNAPKTLPEAAADFPVAVRPVVEPPPAPPAPPEPAAQPAPEPPAASAAPVAQPTASAATGAPAAPASATAPADGEAREIHIVTDPPGARLFWHGKDLGITPVTVSLPAGEKRSYELALRGYITRKLSVDGTKTDIGVGMRPLPAAPPQAPAPAGDAPAAPPAEGATPAN